MTAIFVLVLLLLADDGALRVDTHAFPTAEQCEAGIKMVQKKVPKAKTTCVKVEL